MSKPASAPPSRRTPSLDRFFRITLASLFCVAAASSARAQESVCTQETDDLAVALSREQDCGRNAGFMHRLGRLLNQAQRQGDALDRLETAILIEPELWAAHFDYAMALGATGDYLSAANLLGELSRNPAIDPDLREKYRRFLEPSTALLQPSSHTILGLSTGQDSNLLGVTRYQSLELTMPGGNVPVEISETQRQRSGRFLKLDLSHEADLLIDEKARWRYGAFGSQRWSVDYRPADLARLGILLERSPTQAMGSYSVGVLQQIYLGEDVSLRQWQFGTGVEWSSKIADLSCRFRFGGEFQRTTYPGSTQYDGRYAGLVSHWTCPGQQFQLQLRAGQDRPAHSERPGGEQRQNNLHLAKSVSLGSGSLLLEYDYYRQHDRKGYSALLENNAARALTRSIYHIEYIWSFLEISPYIGIEWLDQKANLPLFSPRNRIISFGFRKLL